MPIVATILFFVFPFLSFPLVIFLMFVEKNNKLKKYYAFLFAIILGLLLYYFAPDPTKDLSRYYTIMERLSSYSLADFFAYSAERVEPLANIYFYAIAKTGNNNLLMLVTSLISYSIILYIIFDYQKIIQLPNRKLNLILFFVFCVFYLVDDISGVRFCIARLVFALALYLDLIRKKRNIWIWALYIIAPMLHSSLVIFVLIRIFFSITKKRFSPKTFFILLAITLSSQTILSLASFMSNIPFLSTLGAKATEYLNLNAGLYPMFILQIVIGILLFIALSYQKKHDKKTPSILLLNFTLIILTIGLLMTSCTSISTRLIRSSIVFAIPSIMDFIKRIRGPKLHISLAIIALISLMSLGFQYSHLTTEIIWPQSLKDNFYRDAITLYLKRNESE